MGRWFRELQGDIKNLQNLLGGSFSSQDPTAAISLSRIRNYSQKIEKYPQEISILAKELLNTLHKGYEPDKWIAYQESISYSTNNKGKIAAFRSFLKNHKFGLNVKHEVLSLRRNIGLLKLGIQQQNSDPKLLDNILRILHTIHQKYDEKSQNLARAIKDFQMN